MTPEKKAQMLANFDAFTRRIEGRYQEAREYLVVGNYQAAHQVLATLATSHAKTSMSLRNMLIRDGFLPEEDKK